MLSTQRRLVAEYFGDIFVHKCLALSFVLAVGLEDDEGSCGQPVLCCETMAADMG